MKSLNTFVNEINEGIINEYRTKKTDKEEAPELKDVKGQDEEENGSGGVWAIEPPTEDDIVNGIDKNTLTRNKKRILMRLKSKKPFFIQGEAGWGKTSIITQLAHQCKRTVITVYLDKAEATDLGGLPVAKKSKKGADYVATLMPAWAKVMYDNPETQFLLFFDEMNQAGISLQQRMIKTCAKESVDDDCSGNKRRRVELGYNLVTLYIFFIIESIPIFLTFSRKRFLDVEQENLYAVAFFCQQP